MKHEELKPLMGKALTKKIIGAFYKVYGVLGYGFLEKVYENALAIELRSMDLMVEQQEEHPIVVRYAGQVVGQYYPDLVVEGLVIVEIKAVLKLAPEHEAPVCLRHRQANSQLLKSNGHRGRSSVKLWSQTTGQKESLRQ